MIYLFERFLNPERVSMPDFDIDFCQNRRDEVIEYVNNKYGKDCVAHIITFGTLASQGQHLEMLEGFWKFLIQKLINLLN